MVDTWLPPNVLHYDATLKCALELVPWTPQICSEKSRYVRLREVEHDYRISRPLKEWFSLHLGEQYLCGCRDAQDRGVLDKIINIIENPRTRRQCAEERLLSLWLPQYAGPTWLMGLTRPEPQIEIPLEWPGLFAREKFTEVVLESVWALRFYQSPWSAGLRRFPLTSSCRTRLQEHFKTLPQRQRRFPLDSWPRFSKSVWTLDRFYDRQARIEISTLSQEGAEQLQSSWRICADTEEKLYAVLAFLGPLPPRVLTMCQHGRHDQEMSARLGAYQTKQQSKMAKATAVRQRAVRD